VTAGPLLLVSKSVRALLPYWHGPLGQLFTPRMLTGLDITEGCCIPWAADNDCFHGFDPGRYLDLLEAISYRSGCLFVAAPNVSSPTPRPPWRCSSAGSRSFSVYGRPSMRAMSSLVSPSTSRSR
jgi:hypothetical protein